MTLDESKTREIEDAVREAGITFDGDVRTGGWFGGQVWLVPTDRSISEWRPIAVRSLE